MTVQQAINRGYNFSVAAFLFISGLAFGSVILNEADLNDKIDDGLLLVFGIAALAWYLVGSNRLSRSLVPAGLAVLMLAAQVLGVLIEHSDKEAFGDNIGGMIVFVSVLTIALYQYFRGPKAEAGSRAPDAVAAGR